MDASSFAQALHRRHMTLCTSTLTKDISALCLIAEVPRSHIAQKDNFKIIFAQIEKCRWNGGKEPHQNISSSLQHP
jgi:hypothetical protein